MLALKVVLLDGLIVEETACWAASRIDTSLSHRWRRFFCDFTYGLRNCGLVSRTLCQPAENTCPMLRGAAGLDADQARWLLREESKNLSVGWALDSASSQASHCTSAIAIAASGAEVHLIEEATVVHWFNR